MSGYDHDLNKINGKINRWRMSEHFILALAVFLAAWIVMTALDVWLRPRFFMRVVLASVLPALALVASAWLVKVLNHKRTPAAVAAFLEKKFPQLDNHLINRVLFAEEGASSPWLKTYMREGVPGLASLPLHEIKNWKLRKRGLAAVVVALLLLLLPAFLLGNAWTISMRRVLNPFSTLAPPTFATVLEVFPENTTILQGDGINLTVKASGLAGQFVDIDIFPSDDRRSTIRMGQFKASGKEEEFAYRVPKIASSLSYRFRVGDAYPTDKYTVDTVPPLALTAFRMSVTPPDYTALPPRSFEAITNVMVIPAHSQTRFQVVCNRPVVEAELVFEKERLALVPGQERSVWNGTLVIDDGNAFQLVAKDSFGLELRVPFSYRLLEDAAPLIRLIAPAGSNARLPPNAIPVIQFEVEDEYGLGAVRLERVPTGAKPSVEGEVLKEWDARGQRLFSEKWVGAIEDLPASAALRVVAYDNNAAADGSSRTVSPLIQFEAVPLSSLVADDKERRGAARKTLAELIARQRAVLGVTSRLCEALPTYDERPWSEAAATQGEIRNFAAALLKSRDAAIGTARVSLERALKEPLPEAVMRLTRMVSGSPDMRSANAQAAINAQNAVLRLLIQADASINKGEISQAAAGVLAMLEGIRKGQTANLDVSLKSERSSVKLPEAVIDRQDLLAQDMDAMIGFCRSEAKMDREDKEFGLLMAAVADKAVEMRLHPAMVDIAEVMESEGAAKAVPPQHAVTNNLAVLMDFLKEWRETEMQEKTEDALAIIQDARQALKKMADLQTSVVEALRDTGSQGDKTEKLDEEMLEEILELKANMAQAMLKVATDLQAMPELDAVNELVTDVFQTYEEMKQAEGEGGTNAVIEIGLQKEDFLLETMLQTGKKADEMEMWLMAKPDQIKRNMETLDKEEMKGAVGQVTMPEELQDIIGDLLEQEKEEMEKADDSVTNQGMANPDFGWGIAEGETVDYSAAGKSGNERPEHKDQDGRSQVGRQGMSDGEVMARSGKINEGDENIDKRRTQDSSQSGDVEEEGHTDAVATGGGKNSGYSQDRGMEGGEGATRRDTKVAGDSPESTRTQLTRNASTVYAQAQLRNMKTYDLKKYIEISRQIDLLQKQNASPAMIAELHKKALRALTVTYTSIESGISGKDMGTTAGLADDVGAMASSPDEAPAEYREMVSEYFKVIGGLD